MLRSTLEGQHRNRLQEMPYTLLTALTLTFMSDEAEGYTRLGMVVGGGAGDWYYGPYIDFYLAGLALTR